jgi:hypothetical protein
MKTLILAVLTILAISFTSCNVHEISKKELKSSLKEIPKNRYYQDLSLMYFNLEDVRNEMHRFPVPSRYRELIILADSKEDYLENIVGFGGKCTNFSLARNFPLGEFVLCKLADPYHIYLKRTGELIDKKNFPLRWIVFETKNGCKLLFYPINGEGILCERIEH